MIVLFVMMFHTVAVNARNIYSRDYFERLILEIKINTIVAFTTKNITIKIYLIKF